MKPSPPSRLAERIAAGEAAQPSASLTIRPEFTRAQAEALSDAVEAQLWDEELSLKPSKRYATLLGAFGVLGAHLRGEI